MILFTIIVIVLVSSLLRPRPYFYGRYHWHRPMMRPRMMHRPPMGMHRPHMGHMGPRRF